MAGPSKLAREDEGGSGRSSPSNLSMRSARSDATIGLSGGESGSEEYEPKSAPLEGTPPTEAKKGRGRPPKDPSHLGMFAADWVADEKEAARERELARVADFIRDPSRKPNSPRAARAQKRELELVREMREVSTAELTSRQMAAVAAIQKVAQKSTNLKGTFLGELWRCSEELAACGTSLALRAQGMKEGGLDDELARARREEEAVLRRTVEQLGSENRLLKARIKALEKAVGEFSPAPAAAGPSAGKKGEKRGTTAESASSSSRSSAGEGSAPPRGKRSRPAGGSPPPEQEGLGGDEAMDTLSRPASPTPSEEGRKARREVEEDRRHGTLPVAMRPAVLGKVKPIPESGNPPASLPVKAQKGPANGKGAAQQPAPRSEKQRQQPLQTRLAGGSQRQPQAQPLPRGAPGPWTGGPGGGWDQVWSTIAHLPEILASLGVYMPGWRAPTRVASLPSFPAAAGPKGRGGAGGTEGKRKKGRKGGKGREKEEKKKSEGGRDRPPIYNDLAADLPIHPPPPVGWVPPTPGQHAGPVWAVPPPFLAGGGLETWATVVRRGAEKKKVPLVRPKEQKPARAAKPAPANAQGGKAKSGGAKKPPSPPVLPKPPRTAAVTVTCQKGTYAEVMRRAREGIRLEDLGIGDLRTRRAATGALVLEVPGPEGAEKADRLAGKMAKLFEGRDEVKIARPSKRAELRVRDLDDATTTEDVKSAVASSGSCGPESVKVGPIRAGANGLGTAWVQCPLAAARRVLEAGRLRVGWASVRVEALSKRPLQCFKCLQWGHVRASCKAAVDRSGTCYRCGQDGHRAADCGGEVACPLCREAGRPYEHRLGTAACKATRGGGGKGGTGVPTRSATAKGGGGKAIPAKGSAASAPKKGKAAPSTKEGTAKATPSGCPASSAERPLRSAERAPEGEPIREDGPPVLTREAEPRPAALETPAPLEQRVPRARASGRKGKEGESGEFPPLPDSPDEGMDLEEACVPEER